MLSQPWMAALAMCGFGVGQPEPAPEPLPPPRVAVPTAVLLQLPELLDAVDRTFPLLAAVEQERAIAEGKRLSAEGGFDTALRAAQRNIQGSYDSSRTEVGVEQAWRQGGISTYGGWRIGSGSFPVYYGDRATAQGGEFRAGVLMPLLRDRTIDLRRATLRQAEIDRLLADPIIQRLRIDTFRAASVAYWNWVAAGARFRIAQMLLAKAVERNEGLLQQAREGAIAAVEATDNQRAIIDRQARLVAAERRLQNAAIELSLYFRNDHGEATLPTGRTARFPQPLPPNLAALHGDIELALNYRPELRRLQLLRDKAGVDLRLAENQALPGLSVAVNAGQDIGQGKSTLDRYTYEAALLFDVPLQRRNARGKMLSAQAVIAQLTQQERFAADRIAADVRDAASALDRAYELIGRNAENVKLALKLEQLEREKFAEGGRTTQLLINIRELTTFDAQLLEVDGYLEYFRGLADYRAALGLDSEKPQPTVPVEAAPVPAMPPAGK